MIPSLTKWSAARATDTMAPPAAISGTGAVASVVLLVSLLLPERAQAYVDPGSGSMFLQLLLASLLGALYTLKTYWRRILGWLRGKSSEPARSGEPSEPRNP